MFKRKTADSGAAGEKLAAKWYRKNGCCILEQNFRTRQGEIDLIVRSGDLLIFVEVKTRVEDAIADPCEFVTPAKQRRLILAAQGYLMKNPEAENSRIRFDVVEVVLPENGRPKLNCIENAFTL